MLNIICLKDLKAYFCSDKSIISDDKNHIKKSAGFLINSIIFKY